MSQKRSSKVKARASRNHRKGPAPKGPSIPKAPRGLTREEFNDLLEILLPSPGATTNP